MGANQSDLAISALDRTLRLMRDELRPDVEDADLLDALTATEVALVAGRKTLNSHAGQTAFIAAALLMARSGHTVYVAAPNVPLLGPQPPLTGDRILDGLLDVGSDLIPGIEFQPITPKHEIDEVVFFEDTQWTGRARSVLHAGAGEWQGWISAGKGACPWPANNWPIGALAAADLIAAEAFKISMRRLRRFALHVDTFDMFFASAVAGAFFTLAPHGTPISSDLGTLDLVSGGAIVQATLFTFSRILGGTGRARVIEPDISEITNLNRNSFLRRSRLGLPKARDIAEQQLGSIKIGPIQARYDGRSDNGLDLQPVVLVGVDHIPTRWAVQKSWPSWLGVGATSHFMAMSSFHSSHLPCAGCLHPKDDPDGDPIPTVACVSFAAGLMMAAQYLQKVAGGELPAARQQLIFRPLRPEKLWECPVASRADCPVACPASLRGLTSQIAQAQLPRRDHHRAERL